MAAGTLVAIVGPTASGKSALATELAVRFNGEIICADSRTVYKGMDIGTAKPRLAERRKVSHHLLDITTPDKPLTAADFKSLALKSIDDITARHKTPFLVGGSGLYVDSVLFDYDFVPVADPQLRAELQHLSVDELQARLNRMGLALPSNRRNPRHLIRAIETGGRTAVNHILRANTVVVGLMPNQTELTRKVTARVEAMFAAGLENEVRQLSSIYGWSLEPLKTIGYREFEDYFKGVQTQAFTKQLIIKNSLAYAKRQKTWFKRNPYLKYISNLDEAVDLLTTKLNK